MGGEKYAAVAEGMVAKRLANMLSGTALMAEGELVNKRWKTADRKEHQRLEIHLIRVTG